MIIGFAKHGTGGSGPVLGYLTGYLVNGEARDPKPEVVRGDPTAVASIIDALPFKRRYTSGVLSFAEDEVVTPEAEEDIMNRFEDAVFAGLPSDRRSIVWIKHRDKGRLELHFVVPRVDLGSRKSLNIAPPTPASRDLMDTLRNSINLRHGLRDPNDPASRRAVSLPRHVAKLAAQAERLGCSTKSDVRQAITDRLMAQAQAGRINGRTDVIRFLRNQGFAVARAGLNYLTVVCPGTGERVRLKGCIYREHFSQRDLEATQPPQGPARLQAVEDRLRNLVRKRATYHQARYAINEPTENLHLGKGPTHDRTGNTTAPSRPAHGDGLPGAREAFGGDAYRLGEAAHRLGEANHNLELAGQRFELTHRKLAGAFEQTLANVDRDARIGSLVRRYGARGSGQSQTRDMGGLERVL